MGDINKCESCGKDTISQDGKCLNCHFLGFIKIFNKQQNNQRQPGLPIDYSDLLDALNVEKKAIIERLDGYPNNSHMASLLDGKLLGITFVEKFIKMKGECTCCDRANEYNGFGSDGPLIFTCPSDCSCHD